jgi:Tfp pilus assembly protein FimV
MQSRDRAISEAAAARSSQAELKRRCAEQEAQLRQERTSVNTLKLQTASLAAEIEGLKGEAALAEHVPGLRADVARVKLDLFGVTSERDSLQV